MSVQSLTRRAALAAAVMPILLGSIPASIAQTQPPTPAPPGSATPPKGQLNIAGQRNGAYPEPDPIDFSDHAGFISLFDGKTLTGWDGQPGVWRVDDGAIVGETAPEMFDRYAFPNTFLICRGVQAKDFDLKLEIKVEKGGGSGIQYRSSVGMPQGAPIGTAGQGRDPRWAMIGPQADFWYPVSERAKNYSGQLYSQNTSRGIIAWRGQVVQALPGKPPQLIGVIGDRANLGTYVKNGQWNQYTIVARGRVIMHILNGQLMAVLVDDDPASSNNVSGLFGLQIEGVPCKVSFRNLWLKKID
jgi:hypothetical protein